MKMNEFVKAVAIFTVGAIVGEKSFRSTMHKEIDEGDVIHNDDNVYIKASKDRRIGYSYARVHYKEPVDLKGEEK